MHVHVDMHMHAPVCLHVHAPMHVHVCTPASRCTSMCMHEHMSKGRPETQPPTSHPTHTQPHTHLLAASCQHLGEGFGVGVGCSRPLTHVCAYMHTCKHVHLYVHTCVHASISYREYIISYYSYDIVVAHKFAPLYHRNNRILYTLYTRSVYLSSPQH